jgi:hypothetical protein
MTERTTSLSRRITENVAMAGLIACSRGIRLTQTPIQRLVEWSDRIGATLRWISPLRERPDTLARGRALAYRWSSVVPGANCIDRAVATRVWLSACRLKSRVVLGFRRRDGLEGHAWLEVELDGAATVLFIEDDDGFEVAISG